MKYYPIQKNWSRKIKPHLDNGMVQMVLVRDFNRYTTGRWREAFMPGMKPTEFESCDWRVMRGGRQPEFWDYVKHAACHWLVNFNRELAVRAEPKKVWRIVTSKAHSTVWDGEATLFDMNFSALGVDADEAWRLARQKGKVLAVGKEVRCHLVTLGADGWPI
jgi:hypothetical protein